MIPSVVVLGHKDHGKSTFLGRLLYETKSVPEDKLKTVREIDAEAGRPFEWAHLLDAFREEREEEMTWSSAAAFINGKNRRYIFFDVPGHEELVHHMLSSASRADVAVLVVSAKEGVDVMSVKHLLLAKLLGVKAVIAAVNKMDAVGWNKEIFDKIRDEIEKQVAKAGFEKESGYYVPMSALEAENIVFFSGKPDWYKGKGVFEIIEETDFKKNTDLPFRQWVQETMVVGDKFYVVGNVKNGRSAVGDELEIIKSDISIKPIKAKVSGILDSSDKSLEMVAEGTNATFIFNDALKAQPNVNTSYLVSSANPPKFSSRISARVFIFREIGENGEPVFVECGNMKSEADNFPDLPLMEIVPATLELKTKILFDVQPTSLNLFVVKQKGEIVGVGRIFPSGSEF